MGNATFARNVRSLRLARGFTSRGLSARVGYHNHFISDIETGRTSPRLFIAEEIAHALGVELVDLLASDGGVWYVSDKDGVDPMNRPFYFVSGVVVTASPIPHFQIMEEVDSEQTCIAIVPFNKHINPKQGYEPAMADARTIVSALNLLAEHRESNHEMHNRTRALRRSSPHHPERPLPRP
jgi:transcriptional regulator with XRE-family HTH domain